MNVWFLIAAMAIVFGFGYRFYAKLLALDSYRLDGNYSTPAQARADGKDYVPTHPHLLFGHHLAAVGGAALCAAPMAAIAWGWIPLFLWITLGTAVVAGTYALGGFWLSGRYPGGWRGLVFRLIGRRARLVLYLAALITLAILAAASAGLAASVLAAYPGAVLPLAAVALIALGFGTFLHGRSEFELLPVSLFAFVACAMAVWLLSDTPLAFSGALVVAFGKSASLSVQALLVWVVLLVVYAFHAARLPIWRLMRPRGFLTSLLLIGAMLMFYVAAALGPPAFVAPQFHATDSTAGALPWIFLLVGPGAIAGWQLLIVHQVTAREMRRESDATYVGYGAALAQGAVALSALLIGATDIASAQWAKEYAATPTAMDFPRLLLGYIEGFAHYVSALYVDALLAKHLAATVIAGAAIAVLEAAVRALKHLLAELSPAGAAPNRSRDAERGRLWIVALAIGFIALCDGRGFGGLMAWPFLALLSLWLAAAGFALIAAACRELARPATTLSSAFAVAMALLAAWCSIAELWSWWNAGAWTAFVADIVLVLAMGLVAWEIVRVFLRRPAVALDT